MPADY